MRKVSAAPEVVSGSLHRVVAEVARDEPTSRARIARVTGLARSTVGQHVDRLLARGVLDEVETTGSVRGRPPRVLTISPRAGVVAVADVDVDSTRIAVADLRRRVIATDTVEIAIERGPDEVLTEVSQRLRDLLASRATTPAPLRQVVVGLPAPVDFARGRPVRPPIMPGWDGYPVGTRIGTALAAPTAVDNDVNLMALGEASGDRAGLPLMCVKMATGIGAGLVTAEGRIHRGADGAAGDIGHVRSPSRQDALCRCGKVGCLEASASLPALTRGLGIPGSSSGDGARALADLLASGDAVVLHRVRAAAAEIGEVIATMIHLYNPRTLILSGPLCEQRDEILSGVRAVVYERALPLATRRLVITTSQLGAGAAITGGVTLAVGRALSADGLASILAK